MFRRILSCRRTFSSFVDQPFVTTLEVDKANGVRPMFRVMDREGVILNPDADPKLPKETLVKMYEVMNRLNVMDHILYEVQRQGRISFYMTNFGEEAMHVGSASALADTDWIYAQYREAGVLMWRGFSLAEFMSQCYSNHDDYGKGRQMPVHYGARHLYFHTIKSTLTTQLPQAAGAAYSLRFLPESDDRSRGVVFCFFGEGAASEGDFHAGLNMAATRQCPVIYFCRNNQWAISTSSSEQFRGDGIVSRASGYGMASIRVDGNDALAVHACVRSARQYAVQHQQPVLIEAMSYRVGHHSTSDDSTVYRTAEEVAQRKQHDNPVDRLGKHLRSKGWWTDEQEKQLLQSARKEVLQELKKAEKVLKPAAAELFNDVYAELPWHLKEQKEELKQLINLYPNDYDMSLYHGGKLD